MQHSWFSKQGSGGPEVTFIEGENFRDLSLELQSPKLNVKTEASQNCFRDSVPQPSKTFQRAAVETLTSILR